MSRRNSRSNNAAGMELKLNLSPPQRRTGAIRVAAAGRQAVAAAMEESPDTSPARSCVSSEDSLKYSSSPETTSMVVVGCPRCLMYVMLSEVDPMCPKCKSTVLLDLNPTAHRRHYHHDEEEDDDDDDDDEDGEAAGN